VKLSSLLSPPQRQSASQRGALPMCIHRHAKRDVRRRAATCAHNGTSAAHTIHVRVSPAPMCTSARTPQATNMHSCLLLREVQVKSSTVRRKARGIGTGSIVQRLIGMLCALALCSHADAESQVSSQASRLKPRVSSLVSSRHARCSHAGANCVESTSSASIDIERRSMGTPTPTRRFQPCGLLIPRLSGGSGAVNWWC